MQDSATSTSPTPVDNPAAAIARFCRLDKLGISVVSQKTTPQQVMLNCEIPRDDGFCEKCHTAAEPLGTRSRKVTHLPCGWRPVRLNLRVPRWGCEACNRQWLQNTDHIAKPRCTLTVDAAHYALQLLVRDRTEISAVADIIGVTPQAATNAISKLCKELHIDDPTRHSRRSHR